MELDHLYSLRRNFTVIGLTGRTGSGCTRISELLSNDFENLKKEGLRDETQSNLFNDPVFQQKYSICKKYFNHSDNWVPFEVIRYKDVLLFYIINKYGGNDQIKDLFLKYYKENKEEENENLVLKLNKQFKVIENKFKIVIDAIKKIDFENLNDSKSYENLNEIFFSYNFKNLSKEIFQLLERNGYFRRTRLFHFVACNIRMNGDPLDNITINLNSIYTIANLINKIIKSKRQVNGKDKPTKIVIDSLRNSLEIMFFKERYSAFYMIATKDVLGNAKDRLDVRFNVRIKDNVERENLILKLLELDKTEYKIGDFSRGEFSSPDVENCIQKSDFHIINLKKQQVEEFLNNNQISQKNDFLSREEQLMKLISLIMQPGLITPSANERCMQIANTAKLNSGCISRKVGAVISNKDFSIKAIGWNDVAKGQTPCNLRNVEDFLNYNIEDNLNYSPFESGVNIELADYKYKNSSIKDFKNAMNDYYKEKYLANSDNLKGKNCSFCFKTVHNHYEGEANQVHTRSLHAEENAMLQISKNGGQGLVDGILFTTASPCELCSKKAYQLGIGFIYYIDPYPGISDDHILKSGTKSPKLIPFSGAIGNAYQKLYEPFLSYKDEISMSLDLYSNDKLGKKFYYIVQELSKKYPEISEYFDANKFYTDNDIKELIKNRT